jgi:hypothetical protein
MIAFGQLLARRLDPALLFPPQLWDFNETTWEKESGVTTLE